jgi:hypothetical protein
MQIRDNYLAKYYEKATIDQLADEYKQKGYNVQRDVKVDKFRVDLMAEKDGHFVYIEVVRKIMDREARRRVESMEVYFRNLPNSCLIIVPLRYSNDKQIEFNGLNEILFEYFIDDFPDELDELSTHTKLQVVDSVVIDSIKVYGCDIILKCSGQVGVEVQYGSDLEQEESQLSSMSYPFIFGGTVTWKDDKYVVTEVDYLRIDTGEYYR